MAGLTCPACRVDPPGFDRCYARFDYRPPVDWLVHGLKYRGELALGRVLGGLLGSALVRNGLHLDVDTIVPGMDYGLGAVYDQDTANLRAQQEGFLNAIKCGRKTAQTLGNYQEVRVRHFNQTLDKYLAR